MSGRRSQKVIHGTDNKEKYKMGCAILLEVVPAKSMWRKGRKPKLHRVLVDITPQAKS